MLLDCCKLGATRDVSPSLSVRSWMDAAIVKSVEDGVYPVHLCVEHGGQRPVGVSVLQKQDNLLVRFGPCDVLAP